MKKVLVILLLVALLPAAACADATLGAVAVYDGNFLQIASSPDIASQLLYGVEMRADILFFQAAMTALYVPSSFHAPEALVMTDAGLALNVLFFSVGLGFGPNIWFSLGDGNAPSLDSFNLKATLDMKLGPVTIGFVAYHFMSWYMDLATIGQTFMDPPVVGVSATLRLARY